MSTKVAKIGFQFKVSNVNKVGAKLALVPTFRANCLYIVTLNSAVVQSRILLVPI